MRPPFKCDAEMWRRFEAMCLRVESGPSPHGWREYLENYGEPVMPIVTERIQQGGMGSTFVTVFLLMCLVIPLAGYILRRGP